MVKLSIIIPYFKTYELTEMLLKQLYIQNEMEIEIILIDDGCNEKRLDDLKYKLYFHNLEIIHQDNIGVAKTRNKGINLAQGKYISFIDCDDQVMPDYIKTLLNAIDKYDTDIINFNWLDITNNEVHKKPKNYAPWKAIYKKETMLIFREDREYGSEDADFQKEINKKIDNKEYSITFLDRVLYIYNSNRVGSLTWEKERNQAK